MIIRKSKVRIAVLGSTAVGLVMGASVAFAQTDSSATGDSPAIETVTVTGSHIRGVAPVGSVVNDVSAADMAKLGASTITDELRDLPQVSNIGFDSTGQNSGKNLQGGGGNGNYGRTINLRGIASQDTLTLVNGMRMVPSQSGTIYDIDSIPELLVQHIDVVADGGSAIYGADAVTGTVNLIYKEPTDIAQINLNASHTKGETGYKGDLLLGRTWTAPGMGDGGLLVSVGYSHLDPLYASALPNIYFDNLTPYLGAAAKPLTTFTTPGNAVISNVSYALPTGIGSTQGVTLSQLGPAGVPTQQSQFTSASQPNPSKTRWNIGYNFKQDITDWLHFKSTSYASWDRANAAFSATGAQTQTVSVPNTNPYSPCATAAAAALAGRTAPALTGNGITCPANGTVSVQEDIESEIGPSVRDGRDKVFMLVGGFDVDLPFAWKGSLTTNLSGDHTDGYVANLINPTAFTQTVSGVGLPSNVPYFNPFCIQNTTTRCNSAITDAYIDGSTDTIYTNNISETVLSFDGPIYHLPGGEVRLAVGAAYENEGLLEQDYNEATAAIGVKVQNHDLGHKNVASHFEELFVPVVGKDNAMWGLQSLEFDFANRYTAYSDFGVTDNPKAGLNYTPVDGLKLHTSWGTSFRAPSIRDESPNIEQSIFVTNNVSAATYPGISVPAGTTSTSLSDVTVTGGTKGIRPETGRTWSVGFDWAPDKVGGWNLEGVKVGVNYYNIHLNNQIDQVARTAGTADITNPIYNVYDIYNPTYFPTRATVTPAVIAQNPSLTPGAPLTQAQYNAIIAAILANPIYSSSITAATGPIIFFTDQRRANSGRLRTNGADFNASYTWDLGWGTADVGMVGTYVGNYDAEITPISGTQNLDNDFTYPIRFSGRLNGGVQWDGFDATVYLNYKNPYRADATNLATGVTAGSPYTHISSSYPVDLSLSYDTSDQFGPYFNNTLLTLAATNVFSQRPPLVLQGQVNYDATEASQLGRLVQLTLQKKF